MSEKGSGSECSEAIVRTYKWVSSLQNSNESRRQASSHHSIACFQSKGAIPKVVHADEDDIFYETPNESLLTKGQFAARKAVSNDLPIFNGKPEEWPIFYSSYIESTKLCGLTIQKTYCVCKNALTVRLMIL